MKKFIYADNAATTKMDPEAFEAMKTYLLEEYGNASQPYSFARNPKKALKQARETIAGCIGALPEEIYFTSGGTESDNWALKGMMTYGDHRATITSQIEHHAVLNSCSTLEQMGFPVAYLPVDRQGVVHLETLQEYISSQTKLVSVMMVNNEIGTIEPIQGLAEIAHEHGALMHTDAVQAVGHISIDVKDLQVDMLSASGHKFNAPKGIGFLYIKKGTYIHPYANGGSQEHGLRAGTENIASIIAMAVALKKNCDEIEQNTIKLQKMESVFLQALNQAGIDYIRNGADNHIPGNVSISIKGTSGEMLLHRLDLKKICISTGAACDSIHTRLSHVIEAIGVPADYAEGTIRVSFGKNNDEIEAAVIANEITKILSHSK